MKEKAVKEKLRIYKKQHFLTHTEENIEDQKPEVCTPKMYCPAYKKLKKKEGGLPDFSASPFLVVVAKSFFQKDILNMLFST